MISVIQYISNEQWNFWFAGIGRNVESIWILEFFLLGDLNESEISQKVDFLVWMKNASE